MKKIKLEIVAPDGVFASQECESISLPSTEGIIEVMGGHEKMMIQLKSGEIRYDTHKLNIISGFALVDESSCKIIVEK
jgi:F0F1-type ATP synthase epsilon subunit